jgi:cellulose synthase/poly-beta-1,6-N-acetylglucosamine synthase-like glycosyltransferase
MIWYFLTLIFSLSYISLILLFKKGWNRIPLFIPEKKVKIDGLFLSVIVSARNEENNLKKLLEAITAQTYSDFELILVNDHSEDYSVAVIQSFAEHDPRIKWIEAKGYGKKNALKEGITAASGEIIIQTDADCSMFPEWLQAIAEYIGSGESDLIIGPVRMQPGNFFGKMQALEFMSLVASGAGAAGVRNPIMCNGANLIYKKKVREELVSGLHEEYFSGDDMFLLQAAKKAGKKIDFLKSREAMVTTNPMKTIRHFFRQRGRWSSKSPAYRDLFLIFTTVVVFGISVWMLFLFFTAQWILLLIVFSIKLLVDLFFLSSVAGFFSLRKCLKWIVPVACTYPFYILLSVLTGVFMKNKW